MTTKEASRQRVPRTTSMIKSMILDIFWRIQPTSCDVSYFIYFRKMHYMFQTVFPSIISGAQNCTYSVRYLSDQRLTLYVQFWAPDDGRKNILKHVQHLTELNKLRKAASSWLYSANILAIHGLVNVKRRFRFRLEKCNWIW